MQLTVTSSLWLWHHHCDCDIITVSELAMQHWGLVSPVAVICPDAWGSYPEVPWELAAVGAGKETWIQYQKVLDEQNTPRMRFCNSVDVIECPLTHWGLTMLYGVIDLGQCWLVCTTQSHCLDYCWFIVNWTLTNISDQNVFRRWTLFCKYILKCISFNKNEYWLCY